MSTRGVLVLSPILSSILGYVAVFGPMAAAFLLTYFSGGWQAVKSAFREGWRGFPEKKWWWAILLLIPVNAAVTLGIMILFDLPVVWEAALPPAMIVPIGLLILLLGAYPEEFGWRGYALPRMLKRWNPLVASLILGVIWGIWHLPLHFIETTTQYHIPIGEYLLQTILLTILYTWLYRKTQRSLLAMAMFHLSSNLAGAIFPYWTSSAGRWIGFFLLLVVTVPAAFSLWKSEPEKRALTH